VSALRACRLLRLVKEQTRHQAFSQVQASHHPIDWAGWKLALVLRGWVDAGL